MGSIFLETAEDQTRGTNRIGCMEPIIATDNLTKTFRVGKVNVPALRGVDLVVQEGEFLAVVGPSGCGKSTLLHVLGGLTRPTGGRVLVDGNDFTRMNDRE